VGTFAMVDNKDTTEDKYRSALADAAKKLVCIEYAHIGGSLRVIISDRIKQEIPDNLLKLTVVEALKRFKEIKKGIIYKVERIIGVNRMFLKYREKRTGSATAVLAGIILAHVIVGSYLGSVSLAVLAILLLYAGGYGSMKHCSDTGCERVYTATTNLKSENSSSTCSRTRISPGPTKAA
jgi:hypothetical protein